MLTTTGAELFFKDWGQGPPVVFCHGWPLSADSWDATLFCLSARGYRCVAHDRRGHGRSSQPSDGNDMNTYADDLAALLEHLSLNGVTLVGFSTGGGEVARYIGRYGTDRVAKVVLVGAVTPLMLNTETNPKGTPKKVFDGFREQYTANRGRFFREVASGPFFGFNRRNAKPMPERIDDWWRQAMLSGYKNAFECIAAFSETDFTEDLAKFNGPTLLIHGDDDQVVPIDASARAAVKLIPGAKLIEYPGGPHGVTDTHTERLNADLLEFIGS